MSDPVDKFPPVPLLRRLPASVAIERRVVPFGQTKNTLVVAFSAPPSEKDVSQLEVILGMPVTAVVKDAKWIDVCIQNFYIENYDEQANSDEFNTRFFRSHFSSIDECGTIRMSVSGYEGNSHWSGLISFETDHPDYAFWSWVVSMSGELHSFNEERIPELKRRWLQSLSLDDYD